MTHSNVTLVDAGLAILSEKDQFVKKIGRDIAKSRMKKQTPAELISISQDGTRHHYNFLISNFYIKHKRYVIEFTLTTVAESDKVRLVQVHIV